MRQECEIYLHPVTLNQSPSKKHTFLYCMNLDQSFLFLRSRKNIKDRFKSLTKLSLFSLVIWVYLCPCPNWVEHNTLTWARSRFQLVSVAWMLSVYGSQSRRACWEAVALQSIHTSQQASPLVEHSLTTFQVCWDEMQRAAGGLVGHLWLLWLPSQSATQAEDGQSKPRQRYGKPLSKVRHFNVSLNVFTDAQSEFSNLNSAVQYQRPWPLFDPRLHKRRIN